MHVVYASGSGPLRKLDGMRLTNAEHGYQRAQLLKVMEESPPFPSDTKFVNFLNNKVSLNIPSPSYRCISTIAIAHV